MPARRRREERKMSRRTGTISLKQCFKRLLLVELALFALMAAGCVLLGQMV